MYLYATHTDKGAAHLRLTFLGYPAYVIHVLVAPTCASTINKDKNDRHTDTRNGSHVRRASKLLTSSLDHSDDIAYILVQDNQIALCNVNAFISNGSSNQNVVSIRSECIQYTLLCWEGHSCVRVKGIKQLTREGNFPLENLAIIMECLSQARY